MFNVVDENLSWYQAENIERYLNPELVDQDDANFHESNLMHGEKKIFLLTKWTAFYL